MDTPRDLGLPYDAWRAGQRKAIRTILTAPKTHVVITAPTGSGKSGIAAALQPLAGNRRVVVLTGTLALQDAYTVFPHLVELRGARHYPCHAARQEFSSWFTKRRGPIGCDEGPCHLDVPCALKESGCTYFDAKRAFMTATAGQTSYASWLAHRRIGQPLGYADVLVCDEAHTLPEQLMQACRVDIPYALLDSSRTPRGHKQWRAWATERLDHLDAQGTEIDLEGLHREQLVRGLKLMAGMDHTWAWDEDTTGFHFEPTVPRDLLPMLQTFDGAAQVVYLSATITPMTLELLGVDPDDVTELELVSTFPVEHRPVYFVPGARGNYNAMKNEANFSQLVDAIDEICEDRGDRRGVIHPVSFLRGSNIVERSKQSYRMVLHQRGESTASVVRRFRDAGPDAILVSPSVMTGHDFPYRDAEFNILAKLPIPNTQSSIMKARCKATPRYRDHYTAQHLVQACGRIVRAEDDRGETFIVDEDIRWWYKHNRDLVPSYFQDAVVETRRRVSPPPALAA